MSRVQRAGAESLSAGTVLDFWFEGCGVDPAAVAARREFWFRGGSAADDAIRARFDGVPARAIGGEFDAWKTTPHGRLALLVLLDQFPRNLRRGTAGAFAGDARALALCREGLETRDDLALDPVQRMVFYLPLEHAEDRTVQALSVAKYEAVAADPPPGVEDFAAAGLRAAREHRDTIERFGRFPHRNAALGRTSSAEEIAFLDAGAPRYGQ